MATKALTVRLDASDYERLEATAQQLGVLPGTLARMLIRESLHAPAESAAGSSLRQVLGRAAALRQRLPEQPPPDVVELVRAGRAELERRTAL
jgi:hypothetical protein